MKGYVIPLVFAIEFLKFNGKSIGESKICAGVGNEHICHYSTQEIYFWLIDELLLKIAR